MSSRSINLQNSPEVQKVYVNWCNSYLRSLNLKVSNLDKDFQNGVLLIKLVEIISGQKCKLKYRQHPKNQIELIDNCSVALRYVKFYFSNGDAYFALVESEFPDQKETFQIKFKNPVEKLKKSFNFANKLMDIPELLDPEDVFKEKMDEFSHFLYTSYFFKFHFQNNKKRIPKENYKNILLDSSSKNSKTEIDSPQKSKFSSPIKEIKSIEQISKIISSPNEMQKEINGMKFIKIESTKNSIFLEWKSRKKEPFYEVKNNLYLIFDSKKKKIYLRPQKEENQKKWVIQKEIITKSFVPKKITFISSTPSFDSCLLQWEIPKHYKIPIEHYEIEIISDEKKKKNKNSKLQKTFVNEIVINKLKPNYLYHFRIRTFNKKGYSEWSDFNSFKTISSFTPSTIQDGIKIIQNDPNHLAIKWNEPENNGHVIDYYQLELNGQIIEHVQNPLLI
ncbi:cortexillin-2 [Anaeramoeba ignava]|uniref:Cortexillin-2 n=1 Tax=Anaeramoeba ignava TaxID=1746090 RepID=A0A9Q0L6A5_ANAIG|nr:cortexillin-2 [Anaeramoeba ignava]